MLSPARRKMMRAATAWAVVLVILVESDVVLSGQNQQQRQQRQQQQQQQHPELDSQPLVDLHADEYKRLYDTTEDKDGLESIRALHEQLDDDNDGTIEPSETGDFIRVDLHPGNSQQQQLRENNFHRKDNEITVKDLWSTWWRSEVHNWTVDQTADWLERSCELPQYAQNFRQHHVTGVKLPLVAVGGPYLNKVIGITNPIHRSKITLKAMDVVLFGPPKDASSILKDALLTSLLVLTVTAFIYAYRQNVRSKENISRLMSDLDSLAKAEQELKEMQLKMSHKDFVLSDDVGGGSVGNDLDEAMEVERLKEELEVLRNELHRAEVELEDKCWMAPPVLQHWLQLTYELESASYNAKRKTAEAQLGTAKDMCDKLKRKRSSLVGAFVSTHGRSIDDVDRMIIDAKAALLDVTKDLQERTARWRQIEMLCGCSIVSNPGIAVLQGLVRHVGTGRNRYAAGVGHHNRSSNAAGVDDADDNIDAHSVAASSSYLTTASSSRARAAPSAPSVVSTMSTTGRRLKLKDLSRESSKESSSSDELSAEKGKAVAIVVQQPPMPKVGPNGRKMVKSLSQDAGSSMGRVAMAAVTLAPAISSHNLDDAGSLASEPSNLAMRAAMPSSSDSSAASVSSSAALTGSASASSLLKPHPVAEEESCSAASDSGSLAYELDANGEKTKKKKKSFFNFRRKKERLP